MYSVSITVVISFWVVKLRSVCRGRFFGIFGGFSELYRAGDPSIP